MRITVKVSADGNRWAVNSPKFDCPCYRNGMCVEAKA